MKTLHLNLKRKWFDMILSGEKKEEYRDVSYYYISRLFDFKKSPMKYHKTSSEVFAYYWGFLGNRFKSIKHVLSNKFISFKQIQSITFSNGYAKDRDQFVIELISIDIGNGHPDLGADNEECFILKLGEIIK